MHNSVIVSTNDAIQSIATELRYDKYRNSTYVTLKIANEKLWTKEFLSIEGIEAIITEHHIEIRTKDKKRILLSFSGELLEADGATSFYSSEEVKYIILDVFNKSNPSRTFSFFYLINKDNKVLLDSPSKITDEKILSHLLDLLKDLSTGAETGYILRGREDLDQCQVVFKKVSDTMDRWSYSVYS